MLHSRAHQGLSKSFSTIFGLDRQRVKIIFTWICLNRRLPDSVWIHPFPEAAPGVFPESEIVVSLIRYQAAYRLTVFFGYDGLIPRIHGVRVGARLRYPVQFRKIHIKRSEHGAGYGLDVLLRSLAYVYVIFRHHTWSKVEERPSPERETASLISIVPFRWGSHRSSHHRYSGGTHPS